MSLAAVILAAGRGARFKSATPKVLHEVAGWPLVRHVQAAAHAAACDPVVVVAAQDVDLRPALDDGALVVTQPPGVYGTAVAAAAAAQAVGDRARSVAVLYGDNPLLTPETLRAMAERREATGSAVVVGWAQVADASGLGRVVMGAGDSIEAIVEEADATPAQAALTKVNTGPMTFDAAWLWSRLGSVEPSTRSGERYLTSLVGLARQDGRAVSGYQLRDLDETIGCDDFRRLASAEAAMQSRLRAALMANGVQLRDPKTTYLHRGARVGRGCVLLPGTSIEGDSEIQDGSTIGPNSRLIDARLGRGCTVEASRVKSCVLGNGVSVGPYAHVRAGCEIGDGCYIGSHAELKAAKLGRDVHVHHFSYLGDVQVGDGANIGAGTVTCNYDGRQKHQTTIGEGAHIGSDTLLVAPVTVARGAKTGAGAVVTRDVPAHSLAYGVPARVKPHG